MIQEFNLISNGTWKYFFGSFRYLSKPYNNGYKELLSTSFTFNPVTDHVSTATSNIFDIKKAAAMYFWYKLGDRTDTSILEYFDEYKRCIDEEHTDFNSNYGYYAYTQGGLKRCVKYLIEDENTRQACFCINNNEAMGPSSIDKLCTNAIHFFIREGRLEMIVQMRSSNFLTLLPYDAFMFTVFYQHVYSALRSNKYYDLETGCIRMQFASLHMYESDLNRFSLSKAPIDETLIDDFTDNNWQVELEKKLLKALNDDKV